MSSAQPPVSSDVGKTVLLLIQAFLKTGYYQPGHPETEKAREGLYEEVTSLFWIMRLAVSYDCVTGTKMATLRFGLNF